MRRGSIVTMAPVTPLPTFAFACTYRPPFLRLYLRRLRALGLAVPTTLLDGRYARWCGDGLELRRGEILILEACMTLSLNDRALELADRLAADAEALRVEVTTLANGARVIDCGARAASRRGAASPRSAWRAGEASRTRRW